MRGEVVHENEEEGGDREVHGSRSPSAMEEGIGECEINVLFRCGCDSRQHQDEDGDRGLQGPGAPVVTHAMQSPQKEKRQEQVKERQQAQPERKARVEKIFRATDEMPAEE